MIRKRNKAAAPDWKARFERLAAETRDPRLTAYYRASCVAADTPLDRVAFLALDLETTGMDPDRDEIVSIGFIPLCHNRIRCREAENRTVRPLREPEETATTIHGITHTHMAAAPGLDEILDHVLSAMAGRVVLAHYSRIERGFLAKATLELTGEALEFPVVDTMVLEARKHPVYRPNFIQRWMGDKDSPSLRLSHARERYGLPPYRPHHALTDALATAELFLAQAADRYPPDTPIAELWM